MKFLHTHKNPLSVLALIIFLAGGFAYSRLQTSLFPEITFPKIKVIADAGQLPVDRMMITVTKPLENAIKQVQDLKIVRSVTSRGSVELSAYMDWKADISISQQRIESKINQIRNILPPDISITVEKMNPSILPVMGYTVESNTTNPIDLKKIALYTIKPFLSQVDGVSEIRVIGGKTKEYWLVLNTALLSTLGLTPESINTALAQTNFVKSNGYLSDFNRMYLTLTDAIVDSKEKLENIVVSNDGKRIVLLKDISTIQINEAKEYVKINANGKDGILIAIIKQPNSNLIEVSRDMQKQVDELKTILPNNVTIKPYYNQADFVNDSIKSVTDSLWVGLLLAIVVAMIFLRSAKASTAILITIPLTICLTLFVLYAFGQTLNIMTIGAIAAAIGLIIDDAIVVVEQIHRTHEEYPEEPTKNLVVKAIQYLLPAMIGSSFSTIVIFLPFELMSGVAGAYFKVMTNTMIITLICSFFVTWILLPLIYILLTKKKDTNSSNVKSHPVKTQKWVIRFITNPMISLAIIGGLVLSIVLIYPKLEIGFFPEMDEGSIVLDYSSPAGTSLEETNRMLREVEKMIVAVPEVETYSRRTGTQMGFFITEPNRGDYLIQLKKKRDRSTDDVISDIRSQIEKTQPALRIDFGQVVGDMLGDLTESVQPIEIKIFGNDKKVLNDLSKQVASAAEKVKGTADVFDGIVITGPSILVVPKQNALAQFGITPSNLQYQLQTSLEGNIVGNVFEKEQLSAIRIVYPGNSKLKATDINKLQIFLPNGKLKPISELAEIKFNSGDAEVQRQNLQMMGVVTGRLDNRDLGTVMKDIQQTVSKNVNIPMGYHLVYGGAFAEQQQSFKELLIILFLASLLVFGVILFLFKNFLVSFSILIISVLGIAGSYLALFITHTALNVGSYTGLIMIVGIIGENAIFTFLQFRESLNAGKSTDDAIVYSISTRLRPKLMTAIGAIIALMPIALGIGTGAQLHQPLAISVIGGFLIALPLLLIVFPSFLRLIFRHHGTHLNEQNN